MKRKYMVLQGLMILNQLLLIAFLCVMNTIELQYQQKISFILYF